MLKKQHHISGTSYCISTAVRLHCTTKQSVTTVVPFLVVFADHVTAHVMLTCAWHAALYCPKQARSRL
jgi:hypothetical protein